MNELKIHGIKELVDIPDYSLYIYMFLWIIGCLIFFAIIFLIVKLILNRKKNKRKIYYAKLKELDLEDSKHSAYEITKYVRLLSKSEREQRLGHELIEELGSYKYKKDVDALSDDIKILFGRYMDSVDV